MARPTTGSVTEHTGRDGRTYRSLRFTAYGKRRRVPLGAVSAADAALALSHVMADVQRGQWKPPTAPEAPTEAERMPTFHEFAEQWWERHKGQYAPKTCEDYRWRLEVHLIPYFGELRLDAISFDAVERYIAGKLAGVIYDKGQEVGKGDPLSPRSINMTLTLLCSILERAVERELIARNPARGKDRRVRERAPSRSYLDAAGQIAALLDAAGALDGEAQPIAQHVKRRAIVATLTFAGLRIGELCALRWRDVDLAGGWLHVGESKTDAGRRRVKVRGALRDELLRIRCTQAPDEYVFPTSSGGQQDPNNIRTRVLRTAVKRANEDLAARGLPPLPDRITPHSLRRTFCSLLYALGESPPVVMRQMGHTDPALALKVYEQPMEDDDAAALRALVDGGVLANSGQRGEMGPTGRVEVHAA